MGMPRPGMQGRRRLPTPWTAEAEEAGRGREVAAPRWPMATCRARPLPGGGAGALGAPWVPALRHPHHRAPAPGPAHRAAPAPAAPRRPPARPGRSSTERSSVQSGGCGAAARMGMASLGSPGWVGERPAGRWTRVRPRGELRSDHLNGTGVAVSALELRSDLILERAGLEPAEPKRWGARWGAVSLGDLGSDARGGGQHEGRGQSAACA